MKKVEVIKTIRTKPEIAIAAFTDPRMLKDWWGVERALIEKRPGGPYTLAWNVSDNGFGFVTTGTVETYQHDNLLVVGNLVYLNPERPLLGPMTLTVRATERDGMTELYLCQDGYQTGEDWDWYYQAVRQAWPAVMQDLKNYLEQQ